MPLSAPTKIETPFATSGSKNTIPVPSQIGVTPGAASYTDGFPPLTMTPLASGGVPPFGQDFNGVLYEITKATQWQQAMAGAYAYDSAFATAVGGYPLGAAVLRSDGLGLWINQTANNSTDPEAGGAGWMPLIQPGATSVTMTGSSVTLTSLQAGKDIIIISGTLIASLNLIFPTYVKSWSIINNTSGSYSITAKTASGTGVAVTQGKVSQIIGDGTNIKSASITAAIQYGYIKGVTLSNNASTPTTTIDVSAGSAADSANLYDLPIASTFSKILQSSGAFATGSGSNGLFTGARANSTWYHVFLIRKDSDGTVDVGFDTSITAANKPVGYSNYRRIGSVLTDGSGNIRPFYQAGNMFLFKTPVTDLAAVVTSTTSTSYTISAPPGVKTLAKLFPTLQGNETELYIRDPDAVDLAPAIPSNLNFAILSATTSETMAGEISLMTNTSSQIAVRRGANAATLTVMTHGWTDLNL